MARGDVAYVDFPLAPGSHVQAGRRPAIVVISNQAVQRNPMRMLVPLTSKLDRGRFPFTLRIEPSQENGLSLPSIALVFQLCAADSTRVDTAIGHLEDHYLAQIDEMMRQMLGLN